MLQSCGLSNCEDDPIAWAPEFKPWLPMCGWTPAKQHNFFQTSNFTRPTVPLLEDLKLLKNTLLAHQTGRTLGLDFALSKGPHLQGVYLLGMLYYLL